MLAPPLACLTWCDSLESAPELVHVADPAAKRIAEETLAGEHVGANLAYDLAVVARQWPDLLPLVFESLEAGRGHDVITAQKLMDIGEGCYRIRELDEGGETPVYVSVRYSLSDLHERYFGSHLEKDKWRLSYGKLRHLPLAQWPEGALFYAKNDALVPMKVWDAQHKQELRAPVADYLVSEPFQNDAAFSLHLIACWGIRTDCAEVERFLERLSEEQEKRRVVLVREGLVREDGVRNEKFTKELMRQVAGDRCTLTPKGLQLYRDWWSGMQKAKLLTEERKVAEKARLFAEGYVSLSADACLQTGNDTLVEYARYGQFKTLISKVSKLRTAGLPIQTSFEPLLETGRASSFSSKLIPNSVAILNLPRKPGMRECFVPRNCELEIPLEHRRVFIAADFGMAELVSLAQVCYELFGESKLRDALNAGLDPHLDFAATMLGVSYEEAFARKHEVLIADARQMAKPFNFGKPGGLGIEKFILFARAQYRVTFGETTEEAVEKVKAFTKLYFKKWPEVREYLSFIGALCERDEKNLCDIRSYASGMLRGRMQYTVAANHQFQHLTAMGFKASLNAVMRRCYVGERFAGSRYVQTHLFGNRVVAPVHDEIVLDARERDGHEAAMELQEVMETVYQRWTPDVVIKTEAAMMRRWRKGAKPVFRNGRLIPYEDKDLVPERSGPNVSTASVAVASPV
jgi:hypothetical protein